MCFSHSVMMFSATFNNILDIWWRSVLLMEETGVPYSITYCCIEYALPYFTMLYQVYPTLSHNVLSSMPYFIAYCCIEHNQTAWESKSQL